MITIILEENILLENMKVIKYLKYSTNNFRNLYFGNVEYMDYLELVYSLLQEFGFDKKKLNLKIKTLDIRDKWKLKLVETLLKGSEVLLIYKTLDYHEEEFLNFCNASLRQIVEKYKLCVITFTTKEKISNEMDHLINI
ncbi:hypothetical protein BACI349Y_850011 [Bacillus sp. 349Y]|nr:hypothetical protein BACI349Y_850011 [Bacillus sp. 349Y]